MEPQYVQLPPSIEPLGNEKVWLFDYNGVLYTNRYSNARESDLPGALDDFMQYLARTGQSGSVKAYTLEGSRMKQYQGKPSVARVSAVPATPVKSMSTMRRRSLEAPASPSRLISSSVRGPSSPPRSPERVSVTIRPLTPEKRISTMSRTASVASPRSPTRLGTVKPVSPSRVSSQASVKPVSPSRVLSATRVSSQASSRTLSTVQPTTTKVVPRPSSYSSTKTASRTLPARTSSPASARPTSPVSRTVSRAPSTVSARPISPARKSL